MRRQEWYSDMSKPVTNVEIEDVLSSIRRLVSTSDRVERSEAEESEDAVEKLVLTPALRVDEGVEETSESAKDSFENQEVADTSEVGDTSTDVVSDAAGNTATADAEEASDETFFEKIADAAAPEEEAVIAEVANSDDGDQGSDSEVEDSLDELDAILSETTDNSTEIDDVLSDAEDAAPDGENLPELLILGSHQAAGSAVETDDDEASNNLQRRAAEFEAIVATTEDAWDPDGTTEDENAASPVGPLPWQEDEADQTDDAVVSDDDDGVFEFAEPNMAEEDAAEASDTIEDTADAAEEGVDIAAIAASGAPEEETGADQSDNGSDDEDADIAKVMADLASASASSDEEATDSDQEDAVDTPELVSESDPAPFVFRSQSTSRLLDDEGAAEEEPREGQSDTAPLAIEEAMLDEDALRDMVSEIVRQELQGALGERITRNVRKLVRREIHRALASQELE